MKNIKKYSGVLLFGAVILGGVTSATFDFSTLPGVDKIKTGSVIQADDILALSHALTALDIKDGDLQTNITNALNESKTYVDAKLGDLGGKTVADLVATSAGAGGSSDYDSDGISDTWEMFVAGGDVSPTDDPDGDGWDNKKEFEEGTDPKYSDEGTCGTLKYTCTGGYVTNEELTDTDFTWECNGKISNKICQLPKIQALNCPEPGNTTTSNPMIRFADGTNHYIAPRDDAGGRNRYCQMCNFVQADSYGVYSDAGTQFYDLTMYTDNWIITNSSNKINSITCK